MSIQNTIVYKYFSFITLLALFLNFSNVFCADINWDGGGNDSLWTTAENWSDNNVPGIDDDVTIGQAAKVVLLGANGVVRSIIINLGDTLTIKSGFNLDVDGDVTISGVLILEGTASMDLGGDWLRSGEFNANSSTVTFDGNGDGNIRTTESFYNLSLNKNAGRRLRNQDASAVKISVANDLTLTSGFFEVRALLGTDLDVDGDITIALDNNNALNIEHNNEDGITIELAGDFTNYNNANNSFRDGNGSKIIFDGAGTQNITTAITLDGEVFENLVVNKPLASTINLANNIQVEGDLKINSGYFKFNGNYVTFGTDAADSIVVSGTIDLDAAAPSTLRMANGSAFIVDSGGTVRAVGQSEDLTIISNITGTYNFEVKSAGTIQANYYKFEYIDSDGLLINDGAIIDSMNNLSNGTIDNIASGGTGINIGDISGSNQRIVIENVNFPTDPGGGASNVTKSLSSDTLEFVRASGTFGGENFDNDPNDLIVWSNTLVTRIWTGTINNDWDEGGNWRPSGVPADSDNVVIPNVANDPTISLSSSCNNMLIREGGSLEVNSGLILTINGNLSIGDSVTASDGTLTLSGTASLELKENYYKRNNSTLNKNNSTIIFNGSNDQRINSGGVDAARDAFYDLTINKTSGTVRLLDGILLEGDFLLTSGTFNANGYAMSVAEDWINTGSFIHGDNTVTFTAPSAGPFTITSAGSAFSNIILDTNNDAYVHELGSNLDADGDITITRGILDGNGYDIDLEGSLSNAGDFIAGPAVTVGGDWTNSGTFTAGSGEVVFDGTGAQTIATGGVGANRAFYDFTVNKSSGTATLTADLEVTSNLNIENGTFDSGARDITVAGNWSNSGSWLKINSLVTFDASSGGPYSISSSGSGSFYDLTMNGSGLIYQLGSGLDVDNDINLTAGTLQVGTYNIAVGRHWITNANATFSSGSGTVTFDGSVNQDLTAGGVGLGKAFNNIVVNKSAGTFRLMENLDVDGGMTISSGTVNMNNRDVNIAGGFVNAGILSNSATLTFDGSAGGPYNVNGGASSLNNLVIDASGVTYQLSGATDIDGNLTLTAGSFDLNANQLTFGNASADAISVSGMFEVDAGAILSMFNGSSLTVNSGGTIRVVGEAAIMRR